MIDRAVKVLRKGKESVICFDSELTDAGKVAADSGSRVVRDGDGRMMEGRIKEQISTSKGFRWNIVTDDGKAFTLKSNAKAKEKTQS